MVGVVFTLWRTVFQFSIIFLLQLRGCLGFRLYTDFKENSPAVRMCCVIGPCRRIFFRAWKILLKAFVYGRVFFERHVFLYIEILFKIE